MFLRAVTRSLRTSMLRSAEGAMPQMTLQPLALSYPHMMSSATILAKKEKGEKKEKKPKQEGEKKEKPAGEAPKKK